MTSLERSGFWRRVDIRWPGYAAIMIGVVLLLIGSTGGSKDQS
jgi:hypothetical protein